MLFDNYFSLVKVVLNSVWMYVNAGGEPHKGMTKCMTLQYLWVNVSVCFHANSVSQALASI